MCDMCSCVVYITCKTDRPRGLGASEINKANKTNKTNQTPKASTKTRDRKCTGHYQRFPQCTIYDHPKEIVRIKKHQAK